MHAHCAWGLGTTYLKRSIILAEAKPVIAPQLYSSVFLHLTRGLVDNCACCSPVRAHMTRTVSRTGKRVGKKVNRERKEQEEKLRRQEEEIREAVAKHNAQDVTSNLGASDQVSDKGSGAESGLFAAFGGVRPKVYVLLSRLGNGAYAEGPGARSSSPWSKLFTLRCGTYWPVPPENWRVTEISNYSSACMEGKQLTHLYILSTNLGHTRASTYFKKQINLLIARSSCRTASTERPPPDFFQDFINIQEPSDSRKSIQGPGKKRRLAEVPQEPPIPQRKQARTAGEASPQSSAPASGHPNPSRYVSD